MIWGLKMIFFWPIMVWGPSYNPTERYSTMEPSGTTFRGAVGITWDNGLIPRAVVPPDVPPLGLLLRPSCVGWSGLGVFSASGSG